MEEEGGGGIDVVANVEDIVLCILKELADVKEGAPHPHPRTASLDPLLAHTFNKIERPANILPSTPFVPHLVPSSPPAVPL